MRLGFESAAGGHGLLLGVAGEPGIGKTTLVEDFLVELNASKRPCAIARGRCSERLAVTEAYLPFLEALDSFLRSDVRESVAGVMKRLAPTWYVQVAPLSAENPSDAHLIAEAKAGSQERMKRELGAFPQEITSSRPIVLFFDDLHWADVSTIDLLAYLATKLQGLRLLIVATYRPSDLLLAKHPFLQIKPERSEGAWARTRTWLYGQEPGLAAASVLTWPLWLLGYPDQALARSQEALRLSREVSHAHRQAYASGCHPPEPPLESARQTGRSPAEPSGNLRLVHRRI